MNEKKTTFLGIQMLRAVLFIAICAFHCGVRMFEIAWGGVETFFVLSSFFLVYRYYGHAEIKVFEQCKKRIKRLYIPYLVIMCLILLLLVDSVSYDLLVAQSFMWMANGYSLPMKSFTGHTWTLSIEVWLGILWAFLLKLPKKKFKIMMWIAIVIGVVYRTITILGKCDTYFVSLCPLAHIDAFAIGSLLAISFRERNMSNKRTVSLSALGAIGIIAVIAMLANLKQVSIWEAYRLLASSENYLSNWFTGNIYLFLQVLSAGVIGLIIQYDKSETNDNNFWKKILIWIGDKSYVLYLFHWPIRQVISRFIGAGGLRFLMVLGMSLVCCLIYLFLEKNVRLFIEKERK